jgi:hypothetical protein
MQPESEGLSKGRLCEGGRGVICIVICTILMHHYHLLAHNLQHSSPHDFRQPIHYTDRPDYTLCMKCLNRARSHHGCGLCGSHEWRRGAAGSRHGPVCESAGGARGRPGRGTSTHSGRYYRSRGTPFDDQLDVFSYALQGYQQLQTLATFGPGLVQQAAERITEEAIGEEGASASRIRKLQEAARTRDELLRSVSH